MFNVKVFFRKSALILIAVILLLVSAAGCGGPSSEESLNIKNVILMIGDGMGLNHIKVGEAYYERQFYMRKGPDASGSVLTASLDSIVTDSAAAATAMACGKKTNNRRIGRDEYGRDMWNIMEIAQRKGKKTGIVVSCSLDDATPAAFSSHTDDRSNHAEVVEMQIRSGIDLFIGLNPVVSLNEYELMDAGYTLVRNAENLVKDYDKIWAVMPNIRPEETAADDTAQLKDLAAFALNFLENEDGFMLMIEGSNIDKKSHDKDLMAMLYELNAFDLAVKVVLDWAAQRDDTLVIVTADHETGGLFIYDGLSKETVSEDAYFSAGGHTDINVPYFIFGIDKKNKPIDVIDNTEIFKLCNKFL